MVCFTKEPEYTYRWVNDPRKRPFSKIESVKYFPGDENYYIVLDLLKTAHFVRFSIS